MSDRVAIIHHGSKVAEGSPSDMKEAVGDRRAVEIQVSGDPNPAVQAITEHPGVDRILSVREEAKSARIRVRTKEALSSVGQLSLEERLAAIDILAANLVQPTLEDAFVALTGSSISESGDVE